MQKRFSKEEMTLEKLQEVREKYYNQEKEGRSVIELTLEEEDLFMLGEDGINTLHIPETENEIEILNTNISEGLDLLEEELAKLGINAEKVDLADDDGNVIDQLEVMDFAGIDPKILEKARMRASQRHTTGTDTGHVKIGSKPTSAHYYDGVKCVHSQLGYLQYTSGVSYVPVANTSSKNIDKSNIIARVYPKEYFTYLTSSGSDRTQIKIKDSNGKWTTGYLENNFSITEGVNSNGYLSASSEVALARLWISKTWGWVKKGVEKKQPLFKNYYSTNGGIPIYNGSKNQIGRRAGYGCYVSGRVGAKTGDTMKAWLQIQFYQTSTSSSPQGKNTFYSAGLSHPYFVATNIDANSTAPLIRVYA